MDTIELAKFLNQISETETHFDNMSKKYSLSMNGALCR